jgi:transposase
MASFALSKKERRLLEQIIRDTKDAHTLRRVQALLWLDDGESAEEMADHLYVSRFAVSKWVKQFRERSLLDIAARVSDGQRSGRLRTLHGVIDQLIEGVIDQDPRKLGYRPTVWTAPLLALYLEQAHQMKVSAQSVRLAIERLRIRWKRPRHSLAGRPPTGRQAKGGSNAGSKNEIGR